MVLMSQWEPSPFVECLTLDFRRKLREVTEWFKCSQDYVFAVLLVELDSFQLIKYTMGKRVGMDLLLTFFSRLTKELQGEYLAEVRPHGELAILLADIQDVGEATHLAEQIQASLRKPFNLNGHPIFLTASIGISTNKISKNEPSAILNDANLAKCMAKANHNGSYKIFYPALRTRILEELYLENELRLGMERSQMQLYYQPIFAVETSEIIGFEALVRWQHPERGLILPQDFIPLAEETGLIIDLDWWVLRQACQQMSEWKKQFPHYQDLTLNVNFSSQQIYQPNIIYKIDEIMLETGLEPDSFKLDIPESVLIENAEGAVVVLEQLRDRGIQLCIDDFGTSNSSLIYLQKYPFNTLKIDRDIVKNMNIDDQIFLVLQEILRLAKNNLGMDVLVERVETARQLEKIKDLDCEYAQGYFFSQPLHTQKVEELLAA